MTEEELVRLGEFYTYAPKEFSGLKGSEMDLYQASRARDDVPLLIAEIRRLRLVEENSKKIERDLSFVEMITKCSRCGRFLVMGFCRSCDGEFK